MQNISFDVMLTLAHFDEHLLLEATPELLFCCCFFSDVSLTVSHFEEHLLLNIQGKNPAPVNSSCSVRGRKKSRTNELPRGGGSLQKM
jgi:hypothetical protein